MRAWHVGITHCVPADGAMELARHGSTPNASAPQASCAQCAQLQAQALHQRDELASFARIAQGSQRLCSALHTKLRAAVRDEEAAAAHDAERSAAALGKLLAASSSLQERACEGTVKQVVRLGLHIDGAVLRGATVAVVPVAAAPCSAAP